MWSYQGEVTSISLTEEISGIFQEVERELRIETINSVPILNAIACWCDTKSITKTNSFQWLQRTLSRLHVAGLDPR